MHKIARPVKYMERKHKLAVANMVMSYKLRKVGGDDDRLLNMIRCKRAI